MTRTALVALGILLTTEAMASLPPAPSWYYLSGATKVADNCPNNPTIYPDLRSDIPTFCVYLGAHSDENVVFFDAAADISVGGNTCANLGAVHAGLNFAQGETDTSTSWLISEIQVPGILNGYADYIVYAQQYYAGTPADWLWLTYDLSDGSYSCTRVWTGTWFYQGP